MPRTSKLDPVKWKSQISAEGPIMRLIYRRDYERRKEEELLAGIIQGVNEPETMPEERAGDGVPSVETDGAAQGTSQDLIDSPAAKQTKKMEGHRKEVPIDIIGTSFITTCGVAAE